MSPADDDMTLVFARTGDALALVDEIVAVRTPSSGVDAARADNGSDLLLAELFDEQRTREIAYETVAVTLDSAHPGTLFRFLV